MSPARSTGRAAARRRRGPGWVPNQHGAWAMLIVPVVVGAVRAGPTWRHLLLVVAWLAAYFAFFAIGLWLRSGRKARYVAPVRAYSILTTVLGLALIASRPSLVTWGAVYAPLLAISLWHSARRADRSLVNDAVTMVAASIMVVVAAGLGSGAPTAWTWLPGASDHATWAAAALTFAYFFGTALYVKTMIRDRGDRRRYAESVRYHTLICVPAFFWNPWAGLLFVTLAVRAVVVPRTWPHATPRSVGLGEVGASVALALLLVTAG
ncbi:MAG: YwiC-like family protein [Cellulomonas sp.]